MGLYLKTIYALYFQYINGQLHCTLLTQDELTEIQESMQNTPSKTAWLCTTQSTVLGGSPPTGFQSDPDYKNIIEQVRYFNGEFSLIYADRHDSSWFLQDSKKKLGFLNNI